MTDYAKYPTWQPLPSTATPFTDVWANNLELNLATTSWAIPAYAGKRTNLWQPDRSIYNLKASNTRFLRAATTAASAGLSLCRLVCSGDSITAGYLGVPGSTDPVTMFLRMLIQRGHRVSALLHTWDGITGDYVGVDTSANTGGGGAANSQFPWVDYTTGSISFTGTGTVLDIVAPSGNGAPYFYSVDGGTQFTIDPRTSGNHAVMQTITGLSDGPHTVVISRNGASGTNYVYATGFRYPTGFVVENAGITGTTTTDWAAQSANYGPTFSLIADTANPKRDAAFISLGVNDFLTSIPVATMKTNLATICAQYKAVNTDPILMIENRPNGSAGWDAYASGIYDVADSQDVPLLDMTDWFGPLATMVINGHDIGDGVHLTAKGGAHQAEALGETVLAEPDAPITKVATAASPANAGTLTIDASVAALTRVATSVAGFTLAAPTNPTDGNTLMVEISPTVTFSLTLMSTLSLVNCSGVASPISVAANKKLFMELRAVATTWYILRAVVSP